MNKNDARQIKGPEVGVHFNVCQVARRPVWLKSREQGTEWKETKIREASE